jgi:hypothetical protein
MGTEEPTKRVGVNTKRVGVNTKGLARIYNAGGIAFSGDDGTILPETTGPYSNSGADGYYTVTVVNGKPITINAITIRVLNHGELNLLTDTGRWYLFAPGTWKTAYPEQPEPGNAVPAHRPDEAKAAQPEPGNAVPAHRPYEAKAAQ